MARKKIRLVDPEDMEILQEDTIGSQVSRLGHRRVKGLLKSIPNMPLDILHEVSVS